MTNGYTARCEPYALIMAELGNIVVADESAVHLYLHIGDLPQINAFTAHANPLLHCASANEVESGINTLNPLYGGEPISLLVKDPVSRHANFHSRARCCSYDLPCNSFVKIENGPYVASPQLVYARMAGFLSEVQLAALGTDLCGRYYIDSRTKHIEDRICFLVTPKQLAAYIEQVPGMYGSAKAKRALKWVLPNSGSPKETQLMLVLTLPIRMGGYGLPFHEMNFDIKAGRLAGLAEQGEYVLDIANSEKETAVEYDGKDSHVDASADKRRRNALAAFGWTVFPIDKEIFEDVRATDKAARQIARKLGARIRKPENWEKKHYELRRDLGLWR